MALDSQQIDKMDGRINKRGAELFFAEATLKHGADNGIDDLFALYAAGRGGVMGEVTAAQIASAFAFFEPSVVAQVWAKALTLAKPSEVAAIYAEGMSQAARITWSAEPSADIARIGRTVVDSVTPLGMALFAGWREMPVPNDPQGAAVVTVMALRELRGDIHVQSVAARGLTQLQAELATRGDTGAQLHGWQPPYADPAPHAAAMAEAQAATSRRMAAIYAVLPDGELEALDAAVKSLVPR